VATLLPEVGVNPPADQTTPAHRRFDRRPSPRRPRPPAGGYRGRLRL